MEASGAVLLAAAGVLSFLIILTNGVAIVLLVQTPRLQAASHRVLVSLCVAQLLSGLSLPALFYGELVLGRYSPFCVGVMMTTTFCCMVSILHQTLISLDRYLALSRPLHYPGLVTPRRLLAAIACTWLASLAVLMLNLLPQNRDASVNVSCHDVFNLPFFATFVACFLFLPVIVLIVTYVLIFRIARSHHRRLAPQVRAGRRGLRENQEAAVWCSQHSGAGRCCRCCEDQATLRDTPRHDGIAVKGGVGHDSNLLDVCVETNDSFLSEVCVENSVSILSDDCQEDSVRCGDNKACDNVRSNVHGSENSSDTKTGVFRNNSDDHNHNSRSVHAHCSRCICQPTGEHVMCNSEQNALTSETQCNNSMAGCEKKALFTSCQGSQVSSDFSHTQNDVAQDKEVCKNTVADNRTQSSAERRRVQNNVGLVKKERRVSFRIDVTHSKMTNDLPLSNDDADGIVPDLVPCDSHLFPGSGGSVSVLTRTAKKRETQKGGRKVSSNPVISSSFRETLRSTKVLVMVCSYFFLSWAPFLVYGMLEFTVYDQPQPPLYFTLLALIGGGSSFGNTVLYFFNQKAVRAILKEKLFVKRNSTLRKGRLY